MLLGASDNGQIDPVAQGIETEPLLDLPNGRRYALRLELKQCSQGVPLMAKITLRGNPVNTSGQIPAVGAVAPAFQLVRQDLSEAKLETYAGKFKVLNIFPSIDTGVCATSVKKFNAEAAKLDNTVVLNISADLPFALSRFCGAEGIGNCESLSSFRSSFGRDWGLQILDSPLAGLLSRAVVVLSPENKVLYSEQVPEIAQEPNYAAALSFR